MVSARHARRHAGIRVSLGTARTYTSSPWPAPVQINKKSRRREEREGRIPRPALARARAAERYGKRTVCLHGEQSNLHQDELGAVVGGSCAGSAQKSGAAAVQPKKSGRNSPGLWDTIAGDCGARRPKGCHEKSPTYEPPSETSRSSRNCHRLPDRARPASILMNPNKKYRSEIGLKARHQCVPGRTCRRRQLHIKVTDSD